ncbi:MULTISPECIES: hypothetical protein [Glycomyces]|uniref:Uncharacterized protein n=2 Tax=Glycomyces TaxID=58113 RepID=A0A9X3PG11_9ACTN|nr:hypothetical protein [Glycomyces lechevalierae]MDA1383479.1 hypothetical protein [Glycomyces lechevalierae]MDR7336485.1 hypothetical protein [Glycomyces lechevalierae]
MTPPDPAQRLSAALNRLYAAFAHIPRPTAIEACPHCWTNRDTAALLAPVPLRDMTADMLRRYAAKALTTVGTEADFRYFVPRLLDIACTTGFDHPNLEILLDRLRLAEWTRWGPAGQDAIRDLLQVRRAAALSESQNDVEDMFGQEEARAMIDVIDDFLGPRGTPTDA